MSPVSLLQQQVNTESLFNIKVPFDVKAFEKNHDFQSYIPQIDPHYSFDLEATHSILAALMFDKKILVHGAHGTGKSSHIEQIAARLNWPCLRINLDGQLSRADLVGRDAIVIENGQQMTCFKQGLLPFAVQSPFILILDEYDAGRPEVMFVIQRLLEENGKLTLVEQNSVLTPHQDFRIFATSNTVGTGDSTGLYHGTHYINQAQMDRWSLTVNLEYPPASVEAQIIFDKTPHLQTADGKETIKNMVNLANMIRASFIADDLGNTISLRSLLYWADNIKLFDAIAQAFRLSYFNRCDGADKPKIAEFYQRCFGGDL